MKILLTGATGFLGSHVLKKFTCEMKLSDYLVEYLIQQGITDVFGYPGGMVTHLMDSFDKRKNQISAHATYHEQGAAFAACGYAQTKEKPGVAYATSGPGATNLITGLCNAYFDSIPVLFITGQVNRTEAKGEFDIRQRGFQETDIVSMVKGVTKYSAYVKEPEDIKFHLDKAFSKMLTGREGPALLDIPMDVLRAEISINRFKNKKFVEIQKKNNDNINLLEDCLKESILQAKRPCLLIGNGLRKRKNLEELRELAAIINIPIVSSMLAVDALAKADFMNYYGFIGAYGNRVSNFIVSKCDLLITLGTRLDVRQVGGIRENFAPGAQIIRVDIDEGEIDYKIRDEEKGFVVDLFDALETLKRVWPKKQDYTEWINVCNKIDDRLAYLDMREPNRYVQKLSEKIPDNRIITTDVGQNQIWVAQSFIIKKNQRVLFSGGHGAMGYSLPAAIGAYYGTKSPVICFTGHGGLQMNIQELQFIARERIPIKIIVLNNSALGMIRHFQEMYFDDRYVQTLPEGGYIAPDFCKIAKAYNIKTQKVKSLEDIDNIEFSSMEPEVIEVLLNEKTYVFPKLEFGKPNQDQEPLIDRELFDYLMKL